MSDINQPDPIQAAAEALHGIYCSAGLGDECRHAPKAGDVRLAEKIVAAVRPLIETELVERGPVERTVCWTCRGTGLAQATGDDCIRCGGRGRLAVVVLGGVR